MFQPRILLLIFIISFSVCLVKGNDVLAADSVEVVDERMASSIVSDFVGWYESHMNYFTITALMALESSFIPIPSEIVLGPAAFFASDPESDLSFFWVIFFASLGSLIGALIIYVLSAWVGRKALYKFADSRLGTFLMLDSDKIKHAEEVFNKRSKLSVCLGRFVAGIRLFISIPAGLAKMNIFNFIIFTFLGSAVYNTALALTGYLLHGQTDLIQKYFYEISVTTIVLTLLFIVFFIARYFYLRYKKQKNYGLIGYPLGHSFSKKYFTDKFRKEKINAKYFLFELEKLDNFTDLFKDKRLSGLNVTIPYKEKIIGLVDELDDTAKSIGAANVIKIDRKNKDIKLTAYNTDAIGFEQSIAPFIQSYHKKALILGTGGASKAIDYVLRKMDIETQFVSRKKTDKTITYESLNKDLIKDNLIIINATPLGTFPDIESFPDIPYQYITDKHLLFDVVYNPAETIFLKKGKEQGATIINGEEMLVNQAEAAWNIWNQ